MKTCGFVGKVVFFCWGGSHLFFTSSLVLMVFLFLAHLPVPFLLLIPHLLKEVLGEGDSTRTGASLFVITAIEVSKS